MITISGELSKNQNLRVNLPKKTFLNGNLSTISTIMGEISNPNFLIGKLPDWGEYGDGYAMIEVPNAYGTGIRIGRRSNK